jgi:hypothetical protein
MNLETLDPEIRRGKYRYDFVCHLVIRQQE